MDDLTEVESKVINVNDIEEEENEACLVGRLVTKKNWDPSNLIEAITKAWKPKHGMSSKEWGESKLILFRFDDAIERDWVLKNQPWFFEDTLFAIEKFTSSVNVTVEHASFWARIYDVPPSCMNERSLRVFTKQIGILEFVDVSGEDLAGNFVRFKVSINITKPLLRGITIQAKGKHLWLPLKHELLPSYCFSCGIIGHEYNDCQSSNRKLRYNTLMLNEHKDAAIRLPHDIVENILTRLPVKYLLRYKLVCKQWEATISDPRFAETHLQRYKNSSSQNLLAWEISFDHYKGLYVAKIQYIAEIQENHIQFVFGIPHSRKYSLGFDNLCIYDGLYLKYFNTRDEGKVYLLWNPSCRAYREFRSPIDFDDDGNRTTLYAIYYNPLMKDYKVVMADMKHYVVFSCRYNRWSEVKEMKDISCHDGAFWCDSRASFNGSVCRLIINEGDNIYDDQIIYFDWKVEKFKKIPMPDCKEKYIASFLTSSERHLYLWRLSPFREACDYCEISIWKKGNDDENDSWMEFKVQFPFFLGIPRPICQVNEGEVLLCSECGPYLLYDLSKNTYVKIVEGRVSSCGYPVLYRENLFLQ